jgi:hypothetical protein
MVETSSKCEGNQILHIVSESCISLQSVMNVQNREIQNL